jgi:ABC-type sugar transport system ATPase subunit
VTGAGVHRLDMRGITKDFGGGRVLHGVDLAVGAGEVHALVGENGAGKSTLMKILAGVHPDHGGTIHIDGTELRASTPRHALRAGIAVIYQEFSSAPDLTVAENLALGSATSRIRHDSRRIRREAHAGLGRLGLDLPVDARVRTLDVGDQQLVEIARAVLRDAKVLVMDEPTARLNESERTRLFDIIATLSESGVSVVYISHFLEEIFQVASRATVLRDGRCVSTRDLGELDVPQLARLMVGDKLSAIEPHDRPSVPSRATPAVSVRGLVSGASVGPVDFDVCAGEILGLAGLQNSGRSDIARALVGGLPAAGRIVLDGRTIPTLSSPARAGRRGVYLLPADRQREGLITTRSVQDNLVASLLARAGSRLGLVRRRAVRRRAESARLTFGVKAASLGAPVTTLSGGNQQKVLLGRAVSAGVRFLVLDQPTVGVDIGSKAELYDRLDGLRADGVAIMVISDDLPELLRLADRIAVVRAGRITSIRPSSAYDRATLLAAIAGPVESTTSERST